MFLRNRRIFPFSVQSLQRKILVRTYSVVKKTEFAKVMESTSGDTEQTVTLSVVNNATPDESETIEQINSNPKIGDTEIVSVNKNSSGSGCSETVQLDDTEIKDGNNPDLNAMTDANEGGVEPSGSNIDDAQREIVIMGCVSGREPTSEPDNESEQPGSIGLRDTSKARDEDEVEEDTKNDSIEGGKMFENPNEMSEVCRPKVHIGSPIVSSFSAGNHVESELSTATHEMVGNDDATLCSGDQTSRGHIPGKAVRIENQNDNESFEGDDKESAAFHRGSNSKDTGRGSGKEKKGRHKHDRNKDDGNNRQKEIFRGIDQNWRTNYDDLYEEAQKKYEYFWRKHCIYSQWHYSVFFHESSKFTCAEQYMMFQKAILFGDCAIANKILKEKDPRRIKSLGRKVHGFTDALWNANCLQIVKQANIAKFSQNKHLKETLFATYPKILVEASPVDAIWGIGLTEDDERAWDESTWEGKNYLGYVITEVRDELMADEGIIPKEDRKIYLPTLLKQMEKEKGSVEEPEAIEEDTPV